MKKHYTKLTAFAIAFVFFSCSDPKTNKPVSTTTADTAQTAPVAVTSKDDTEAKHWVYDSSVNEMGDALTFASIDANDLVQFAFPYNGGSVGQILIRKKNNSLDIMFSISKGQIDTDFEGTYVRVKFDDGKPQKYLVNEPSDGSTTIVFFTGVKGLLEKIKHSKKMVVEVPFYQNGLQQFVFDVEGLEWK